MGFWSDFGANLKDALLTGGDRQAFNARRNARLRSEGRDERFNKKMGRVAVRAYERAQAKLAVAGPYEAQYKDEGMVVKVKSDYSIDHNCWTTSIIIAPRDGSGHQHIVIDEQGREIYNKWVSGR